MSESYSTYDQVPWYRKNWCAIIFGLFFVPPLFFILATGDVYYEKDGQLKTYSKAGKIFILICGTLILLEIISSVGSAITS